MQSICFVVEGDPVGKPRMTQRDKWQQRPAVMRYREFADRCRAALHAAGGIPRQIDSIRVEFYIRPPQSRRRKSELYGTPHRSKPDVDNLVKSVMDALCKDDSCIWHVTACKMWDADPRTVITLYWEDGDGE